MRVHSDDASLGLLERESDVSSIDSLVAGAAAGAGAVLLIRGAAGVGKTELLRVACRIGAERGMGVLSVRGTELERHVPYGLARQLADRALAGRDPAARALVLEGPAGLAVGQMTDVTGPASPSDDPALLIPHGLFWLVANLAAQAPLLLAVDDAHWCDAASSRFLRYLAPRLEGLPVLLALSARDDENPADPAELSAMSPDATVIEPLPLSPRATSALVRARVRPDAHTSFCAACHEITGGNPFFVIQLTDALRAEGFSGRPEELARVREVGPGTVAAAVLMRLSRLAPSALTLANAVAVLGEHAELRHILRLADLDEAAAADQIAALSGAGLIDDTRPLVFVHPIVRNAIYRDLTATQRARAHRHAAKLLMDEDAPSELVAAQLLLSDPSGDADVAAALRGAAADALARGAPDVAVTYLTRALTEPPPAPARAEVLMELGIARAVAHDPEAIDQLAEAINSVTVPSNRAAAARLLARELLLSARMAEGVAVLDEALTVLGDRGPDDERELALALASDRAFITRIAPTEVGSRRAGSRRLRTLLGDSIEHPVSAAERTAVINIAVDETSICTPAEYVVALAERGIGHGHLLAEQTSDSPIYGSAVLVLMFADQLEQACQLYTAGIEDARRRGSVTGFVQSSCFRAHTLLRLGRPLDAEADARASLETEDKPLPQVLPMQLAALVDALIDRGELALARQELARRDMDGPLAHHYHASHLLESRARLHLAEGRPDDAFRDAIEAGQRQEIMQMPNPSILAWRSTAALAAAATGDRAMALELATDELRLANQFGAPRAVGIALRARGLVCEPGERIARLQEAVTVLADTAAGVEHARALVDLGAALRRDQRRAQARDPLRLGLDMATAAGADGLAARARDELAATGAKPRSVRITGPASLTPSERRVARMAADGLTNNQIAQALFVTPRTVEMHLTSTYRKLSIGSRAQLAEALEGDQAAPEALSD
ncbi:MAG TPA: AAA family ATPase [Streptosporangiaceae bacterium]|nr:AAA family ATPase [Streptosporangiaceae bacterium]